jgi:hypothetical protein
VVPRSNVEGFRTRSWVGEVRWWPAPRPADEGVSLLAETIRALLGRAGRVGAEIGPETGLGMPVAEFLALQARLPGTAFADGGAVLQRVVLEPERGAGTPISRMGHGLGLDLTEPCRSLWATRRPWSPAW